jgi:hypothetical protein
MMPGGQQISPALVQALTNVSSSGEDAENLKTQMALAQAMRGQQANNPAYIPKGGVAVRQSPLASAANAGQNMLSQYEQMQTLKAMQAQATILRDARGKIISDAQAHFNAANNPSANHPDTNAAIMPGGTPDQPGLGLGGGNVSPEFNPDG